MWQGKTVVLGITGGIAAYKACELVRLYRKAGAEVHVIMTAHAQEFVTPLTLQTLTNQPVHTQMFNLDRERDIDHIALAQRGDLFVVAPATANIIGKAAQGIADDLLSTTLLATRSPLLWAPAMNVNMWQHPQVQANLETLRQWGHRVVPPASGELACGWQGEGKLAPVEDIFAASAPLVQPQDWQGTTVLITAGPTREAWDPVRFLSNHSSGKMGYALARAAWQRGARVLLVSGPTELEAPYGVTCYPVTSAAEMAAQVKALYEQADVVIKTAAVADYRPAQQEPQKVKKSTGDPREQALPLARTEDILAWLGAHKGCRFIVGFAAETQDMLTHAQQKLTRKGVDMMVANDLTQAGSGFGSETNEVCLLTPQKPPQPLPQMCKERLAQELLSRIHQERLRLSGSANEA